MDKVKDFFFSYNVLKLKIVGFIGTILLTFAWSGIIKNIPVNVILGTLGASSITIFTFLMNEAYKNTKSVTLYMVRLIVLSLLSAFPYFMVYHNLKTDYADVQNYFSTPLMIFFCLGTIFVCDRWKQKPLRVITLITLCILAMVIRIEFAPFSVIVAYFIHEYDGEKQKKFRNFNICLFFFAITAACICILYLTNQDEKNQASLIQSATIFGVTLGLPFINGYNGKITNSESVRAGKFVKWSGYFCYLLFIVLFAVLKFFLAET